ncbi:protein OXIDATIVE STRESS 3-like [Rhododendron vialii]|uniref:protein OXIDATIVE STRESS 3-like n=1 Tax=Rhododendron vialii TaxID=182163 RepID=UPI00265ED88C|nr:protein OXIDATIVE STRESS 3-like [Rhododendron vialii]
MGEGKRQMAQSPCSPYVGHGKDDDHDQWTIIDGEDDDHTYKMNATSPSSSTSSSLGDSTVSNGSSLFSSEMVDDATSSEMVDDATSSTNNSSSSSLDDLSDLMAQLPIKRGLSKFYQGKSQSFTTLSRVTSIEDLPKKESTLSRRQMIKASKSYAGGLDRCRSYTLIPKPIISKKTSRGSLSSLSSPSSRRGSFVSCCRPPRVHSQNKLE